MPSIRSAIASLRRAARLLFDRCATARPSLRKITTAVATAPETRPLPAVSRAHPPATSTDCPAVSDGRGGEAVIPRPIVRGPIAIALPRSRSPRTLHPDRFEHATAGYVDRLQAGWGPIIGRERRPYRPLIAPSPSRPRRRSNSDHPGKSTYSRRNRLPVSHFPNRFPVLKPVTGFPVPV